MASEGTDGTDGSDGTQGSERTVAVDAHGVTLGADLTVPEAPTGVVAFAHGSGSSRHSPRNRQVAGALVRAGFVTLLLDLLTAEEEEIDRRTGELRFDIDLLAARLTGAVDWLGAQDATAVLPVGLFGASTGAAAALVTAAERPAGIQGVVSRGGRPDLAGDALGRVRAPTLLIVGGEDHQVIALNERAMERMDAERSLEVVPEATHLFEEPGALEEVARLAADWFGQHLAARS